MGTHYGVDVSSNNSHPINWAAVCDYLRQLGGGAQPFVVVKVSEGTGYLNPDEAADVAGARQQGAVVAGYLFDHGSDSPQAEETEYAKAQVKLPQFDDIEAPDGMSAAAYSQHAHELYALVPSALEYLNKSEVSEGFSTDSAHLWLADYNNNPGHPAYPALIHQYWDRGQIPGASGTFDLNVFCGTEDQFQAVFTAQPPAPAPSPNPTPKPAPPVGPTPPSHRNTFTPVAMDGKLGPATIRARQFVDFNGNVAECDGVDGPRSHRAMQAHLGVKVDGVVGPATIRALQAHVGAPVDGKFGPITISHLQAALNTGNY